MEQLIQISFHHGIGDCTYFAHELELYTRRGFRVELHCGLNRAPIFSGNPSVKVMTSAEGFPSHSWCGGPNIESVDASNYFLANKAAVNILLRIKFSELVWLDE